MTRLRTSTPAIAVAVAALFLFTRPVSAQFSAQDLVLFDFGVLGGAAVTNTGDTVINGSVGVSPDSSITGFPPGLVTPPFTFHQTDAVAAEAQADLNDLIVVLNGQAVTQTLAAELNGANLGPGVYEFLSDEVNLASNGVLTLDAGGNPNAEFIFLIDASLTTGSASAIELLGGAQGINIYWVVTSSATLGAGTDFAGRILATAAITLVTGATIDCGAAWAQVEAVTLDTNVITTICTFAVFDDAVGDDEGTAAEIADVIDDFIDGGGVLPGSFQELLDLLDGLTPDEVAAVLAQLAGEGATGVATTGMQAMNSFLSTVLNSAFGPGSERRGPGVVTVKALGYAGGAPLSPASSAAISFGQSSDGRTTSPGGWEMWVAAFGGQTNTDGDSGAHDRFSSAFGIAGGFDFDVTPDTRVGIAFGGGMTDFDLSDALGGGSSNMFQTAIYSRTNFDEAYVSAALAYGYHDVSTDRTVTVTGIDRFSASFSAHNVAGEIEAGYRFDWVTPYAALRLQTFHTPDYSETTESGSPDFALDYEANTTFNARTEVGARFEHIFDLDEGASLALRSRVAWAHDFWSGLDKEATFQALPGSSSFTVHGAEPPSDSLLLSAGAEIALANGISLAGWIDTEFAKGSETYAGNARVSYVW